MYVPKIIDKVFGVGYYTLVLTNRGLYMSEQDYIKYCCNCKDLGVNPLCLQSFADKDIKDFTWRSSSTTFGKTYSRDCDAIPII